MPFPLFDRDLTRVSIGSYVSVTLLGLWLGINRGFGGFAAVVIGLGALGVTLAWGSWKRRDGPPRHRFTWMVALGMRLGCFIAAVTAFSAVNLSRIDGLPTLVVWLGRRF